MKIRDIVRPLLQEIYHGWLEDVGLLYNNKFNKQKTSG